MDLGIDPAVRTRVRRWWPLVQALLSADVVWACLNPSAGWMPYAPVTIGGFLVGVLLLIGALHASLETGDARCPMLIGASALAVVCLDTAAREMPDLRGWGLAVAGLVFVLYVGHVLLGWWDKQGGAMAVQRGESRMEDK